VRRYLRDPKFSRFDTIPECDRHTHTHTDRQTDRHTTTAYTALSKASRGKNCRNIAVFTAQRYASAVYAIVVCLWLIQYPSMTDPQSVGLSYLGIVSKRLNVGSRK